jgi:uncharacterized membrane protein
MANPTELTSIFESLVKEINEAGQSDLLKGSIGSIKDLQAVLREQDKLIDKTLRAGDEKAAMRIIKNAKLAQEAQVEATNNLREAKEKLLKLEQEGNTKGRDAQLRVIGKINQEINKLAREAKLMQKNAAEFGKGAEYSMEKYQRVLENREERIKELGKTGAILEEKFANRFEASVNAFTSGVGDLESFGDTFTGGLKSLGSFLQERKGKAAEKAAAGKGSMGMANMLGGLSKVVGTLAVVGGSIMMLVKLFKFVEGTVIEANKALLEGGVAINDLYVVGMHDTQKNLEKVRDTFRDPDFANAMGIPLEDTMGLVTAFNDLNMGIKQFGGGVSGMERMKESMKEARGFAYGLGISMDEAQQYMAKFSFNMGVAAKDGTVVGRMASDFAAIRDMALQSSYSTGNFFKKIESVVEELDNMNLRTKEAGALLIRFGRAVGKSGLDKALQQLFSGFRSEGYLDQMKRNMLTKSDKLVRAVKAETIRVGKAFAETYGGKVTKDEEGNVVKREGGEALEFVLQQAGAEDMDALIEKMSTMNAKEQQKLMADLNSNAARQAGVSGELKDELYRLMRLSKGSTEKATAAERQAAQEEMGAGGNVQSRFALIESVVGNRNINDLSVLAKEALGQFGVDKDQLEAFAKIQTTMKGQFTEAQRIAKERKKLEKQRDKGQISEAEFASQDKALTDAFAAMGDIGVKFDETGRLVMKDTGMLVQDFSGFLSAQGSKLDEKLPAAEVAKTQEQYLDEGVKATTSVFNVLNNTIAGILNNISSGIYSVVQALFGGDLSEDEKKAQRDAINQLTESMNNARGQQKEFETRANELQKQVEADKFRDTSKMTEGEKAKFKQEAAKREEELARLRASEAKFRERAELDRATIQDLQLNAYDYSGSFFDSDTDHFVNEAREKVVGKTNIGKLGQVRKVQEADMAVFAQALQDTGGMALSGSGAKYSITSYEELNKYLSDQQEFYGGVADDRITRVMAQLGLTYNREQTSQERKVTGQVQTKYQDRLQREGIEGNVSASVRTKMTAKGRSKGYNITESTENETTMAKETIEALKEPVPKAQRDKEAREAQQATEKATIEAQTKAIIQAAKETKEDEVKAVAKALNLSASATPAQIAKAYASASDAQKAKLRGLSVGGNETVQRLMGYTATPAQPAGKQTDFWIDGRGNLWSIDPQDFPTPLGGGALAMTKPGGPVAEYVNTAIRGLVGLGGDVGGGGGGGGGNQSMVLNFQIDGSKNPVETGRKVVQEIKRSQEKLTGRTR